MKGRFCKLAEDGVTGADKNGVKLICKADAGGKPRWQAASAVVNPQAIGIIIPLFFVAFLKRVAHDRRSRKGRR